jgi:hypothetical protein
MTEIVTKDGRAIPLRPVGRRYVEQIMAKHPVPDAPTYTATIAGGETQTFPHDETTLNTPEEWAAWRKYEADKAQAISAMWGAVSEFLICRCVVLSPPPVEQWSIDFAEWGLTPPDASDPKALKVFWVENELVPDPDDQGALMGELYRMGGIVADGKVKEFEAFFRLTLARLTSGKSGSAAAGGSAGAGA